MRNYFKKRKKDFREKNIYELLEIIMMGMWEDDEKWTGIEIFLLCCWMLMESYIVSYDYLLMLMV